VWPVDVVHPGHLAFPLSSFLLTRPAWVRDESAMFGPNRRQVLIVGGTRVPVTRLACRKVGRDGALGARGEIVPHYSPCQSRPPARAASAVDWCICMVWGTSAPRIVAKEPGRRDGATFVWALVSSFRPSRPGLALVGNENYSCERASCRSDAETPCVRQRLVVRGGNLSKKPPPAGDLSGKPPTSWRQGVLPVMVLARIHSPPCTESWPSHCQWCQMTPSKGGSNPGHRQ
jgi:hypothetical protein